MFCPKCGENLEDGAKFCPSCGAVIEEPTLETEPVYEEPVEAPVYEEPAADTGYTPAPEPAKKGFAISPKIIAIAAGALLALILVVVLLTSGGGSGTYTFVEPQFYVTTNDETAYIVNGNGKVQTIEFDSRVYSTTNATGKVGAVHSDGVLYWFDQNTNKKVTEECAGYYAFSMDGSVLVYTQEGDDGFDLYIYKGGKSTKIASDISTSNLCISPNGSAIGFCTYDSEDSEYKGYVYDGKIHELGKNKVPVAVTNGASLVYLKKEGAFFVQKKFNEDSRVKLAESASDIYYNIDLTEVLVYDGEKTVYSANGGEKKTAFKYDPSIITPLRTHRNYAGGGIVYGVKSFIGSYAYNDGKLVRLNRDMSTTSVAKGITSGLVRLASDGKTVLFQKDDQIKKVNGAAKEPESTKIIDEVEGFVCTEDGKTIFYSVDGELYSIKASGGKGTKITDEFEDVDLYKGTTLIYSSDDVLYSSTGGKGQKMASFDDDISSVSASGKVVIVKLKDGTRLYSTNGKTFKVLFEG